MSEPLTAALRQPKHPALLLPLEVSNKRQTIQEATKEKVGDAAAPLLKREETPEKTREKKPVREINLVDQTLLNRNILAVALEYLDIKAIQSSAAVCKLFNSACFQNKRKRAYALAFGKKEWGKYFGDVGKVPPIPDALVEAIHKECLYWPGKSVAETHLLTLIPKTVNGKPFTHNLLQELIQSLQERGHTTQYSCNHDNKKKEHRNHSSGQSYWSLVTRDVIPNSRSKTYSGQKALLKGPYEPPRSLEMATAILMHHVGTGERLYPGNPQTYTRCQEAVGGNTSRVFVGGFGSSGLYVYYFSFDDSCRVGHIGLGGSRKC